MQAKTYGSAGSNHCDGGVLWLTPDRDLQLMAQGEILENQIAAAAHPWDELEISVDQDLA